MACVHGSAMASFMGRAENGCHTSASVQGSGVISLKNGNGTLLLTKKFPGKVLAKQTKWRGVVRAENGTTEEQGSSGSANGKTLNPFAPGKLSSRIATKGEEQESKSPPPPTLTTPPPPPPLESPFPKSPFASSTTSSSSSSGPANPFATLTEKAARKEKIDDPLSPLKGVAARQAARDSRGSVRPTTSFGGKKLLDAFKEGDKFENKIKVGQPKAPSNIFDDPRRTAAEIEAEKWRFSLNSGQILLILSFFASSLLMFATVWVVWKAGAIHFNEY